MTMRAVVCHAITPDLTGVEVRAVPTPSPGPGEALIRVRAASINFPDILMCQGRYQFKPDPPFTPGLDVAGDIAGFGPGTERRGFELGQSVVCGMRLGGFAEFAVVPVASLLTKPAPLGFAQAAAYPAVYHTARVALVRRGQLQAGETLLVLGAAGGVGLACVDLGLSMGARVIAAASTPEKRAFLKAFGAHETVGAAGFRDAVLAATNGRGADVIYDPVGGDVFDEAIRLTAFEGRYLVVGFASGRIGQTAANIPLIKGFSLVGVRAGEYARRFPERGIEDRAAMHALAEAGAICPHVHAELPLDRVVEAMGLLQSRAVIGKVVLRPDQADTAAA
ncbi:MAG: NADPH:quinone oxidoreductase family protein [Caulobacterales bacterium]|jgi:NADPH2:quinone reductase